MLSVDPKDLKQLTITGTNQEKSFKVPSGFNVREITEFMWLTAKIHENYMVDRDKTDPCDHLVLNVRSRVVLENGEYELIPLDTQVKLIDVINYLWIPLNPEWNPAKDHQIRLYYSRKKKEDMHATPM
jgi:hypothetical protein